MPRKKLTPEQEKEIKLLLASNQMLEKTQAEAEFRGQKESIGLIENARLETIEKIRQLNPKLADEILTEYQRKKDDTDSGNELTQIANSVNEDEYTYYKDAEKSDEDNAKENEVNLESEHKFENGYNCSETEFTKTNVQYDVIPLPSNGQCYSSKIDRLPVAYLTAYDENLITSPNLYKDGMIIDFLLKSKILDKKIKIENLCCGDADAITLFLRATSYGPEFPIIVKDPQTGQDIETTIDLSSLKVKEFTLVGDENGYFDYTLPVSNDTVKFRFLTRKDEKILKKLSFNEDIGIKALNVKTSLSTIIDSIKTDKSLKGVQKQEYINNLSKLDEWVKDLEKKSPSPFNKTITNRLELSIMAVNGNYDKRYISDYIKNMGARDSLMLRRYILNNEPGIDFEIEVQRPKSLGGGSFKTFLEWDDSIFLNIA